MKVGLLVLISTLSCFMLKAQALNAFFLIHHTAGCDNASGKVSINAVGGNGNYTYLWSNGSTIDTAYNLGAGSHFVTVYSGLDSVTKTIELDAFGVENVLVNNACNGDFGTIYLDNITATHPIQIQWFNDQTLLNETTTQLNSLVEGTYHFLLTDAEGCIDSGTVSIHESTPQMDVFLSDSSLCWYGTSQVWFTPGFTLVDNWGNEYNSTVDTFTFFNNMASSGIPEYGMDAYGCFASVSVPFPFVFLQGHPDPIPIYFIQDTLSLSYIPNTQADPNYTYTWSYQGSPIDTNNFTYLEIDSNGFYTVLATNIYGCSWYGTIDVNFLSMDHLTSTKLNAFPNPSLKGDFWNIEWTDATLNNQPFELLDCNGKILLKGVTTENNLQIEVPSTSGIYLLHLNGNTLRLTN